MADPSYDNSNGSNDSNGSSNEFFDIEYPLSRSDENLSGSRNIDKVEYKPYGKDGEFPSLNGPGSGRPDGNDVDENEIVNDASGDPDGDPDDVEGGSWITDAAKRATERATEFADKVGTAAGNVADAMLETGESRLTAEIEKLGPTKGGAEYTLLDTVMLVFIILAILMLLYVVLAESGVLSVAESGANYLITVKSS